MKDLELVRATEEAAIAASEWVGSGDKLSADKAATEAMRHRLNKMSTAGVVVISEGKKDNSHMLYPGERVGNRDSTDKVMEIAVDPIDGTRPTVNGGPEAMSVIAVSDSLWSTEVFYMNKLAYGPAVAQSQCCPDIRDPIEKIVMDIAVSLNKSADKLMVCILDRPRHKEIIDRLRTVGVRIKLIQDCDISGAIASCRGKSGIDFLYGAGGSPEAVITACAMKCLRGGLQAMLVDDKMNVLEERVYTVHDMVRGECAFAATGITDGSLLQGVRMTEHGPMTRSVHMRSESGTIRWIETLHGN